MPVPTSTDGDTTCAIVVAIPVRDEAERIEACLLALASQTYLPTIVLLLLNNCADQTEIIARRLTLPFCLNLQMVMLPPHEANAGTARRLAMEHAASLAGQDGIVLTTDADAVVPPDWIALNLRALAIGADAVCGQVVLDAQDAALIPAHLHDDDAMECLYAELLDEIAEAFCPDLADPKPRHTEASGASLAVTVTAFHRCGGMPHVSAGEDRAFIAALKQIDARIRHDPAIRVTVSGRTMGRAPGGMADTISRRIVHQDEFTDAKLEPAGDAFRRADFRRRVRKAWSNRAADAELAADLHLSSVALNGYLQAQYFGKAWAHVEHQSPMLRRCRVRFVDLSWHIKHARELLASLKDDFVTNGRFG